MSTSIQGPWSIRNAGVLSVAALLIAALVIALAPVHAGNDPGDETRSIKEKARKAKLRYKGKSFDEWREPFLTDITPAARQENLKGLAFFARHGFAAETVAAILEMACEYDDLVSERFRSKHDRKAPREPEENDEDKADINLFEDCLVTIKKAGPVALPALREGLKSDHVSVHFLIAGVLREMGPAACEAIPELIQLTKSRSQASRFCALGALASVGEKDAKILDLFQEILRQGDVAMRAYALESLQIAPGLARQSAPAIIKSLDDKNALVCESAIGALEMAEAGAQAVPALIRVLKRKDVKLDLAYAHLQSLGAQAKDTVPALLANLERAAKKKELPVQQPSFRKGDDGIYRRVGEIALDDDEFATIVDTLAAIGPAAAEAVPALKRLLAQADAGAVPVSKSPNIPGNVTPAPIFGPIPVTQEIGPLPATSPHVSSGSSVIVSRQERIRGALTAILRSQKGEK